MAGSDALTLEESARVAGHARWLETRLFEVLGSWVAAEPDAAAKVLWSTHSLRHATGADVWRRRQPRVAHLDRDVLTVPAGPGVAAIVDALAGLVDPEATASRLVAVARVVEPRRLAAYRHRCERAHPLADGPTLRWTKFLLTDAETCRAEAEGLLTARPAIAGTGPDAVRTIEAELTKLLPDHVDLVGLTNHVQV